MIPAESARPIPLRLVCPRCRVLQPGGSLRIVYLEAECPPEGRCDGATGFDGCSGCGTRYPRIEGIHCVPPDLPSFLESQSLSLRESPLFMPEDMESAVDACRQASKLQPFTHEFREVLLPAVYALAHFPGDPGAAPLAEELSLNNRLVEMLAEWLEHHRPREARSSYSLEVGCGPGRLLYTLAGVLRGGVVGFDLRLSMLRVARRLERKGEIILLFRSEGTRFEPVRLERQGEASGPIRLVQGDIASPPFEAESFPVVIAMSLLDTMHDPIFALGQIDALLAPGGVLIVGNPYHWEPDVTSPELWWSNDRQTGPETMRSALRGTHPQLPHLRYEILQESSGVPWALPGHRRLVHRYLLDVIVARKDARRPGEAEGLR